MEGANVDKLTMNISEAAKKMGICENTMRALVHSKGFPKIKCGRRIVIPIKAFEEWVNNSVM